VRIIINHKLANRFKNTDEPLITVLQARMFAYPDAARYRLGTNYQMLPTNAAHVPVYCPFQRDGFMNFGTNYGDDPNYVGSSLKPTTFERKINTTTITEHEKWVGEVVTFTSQVTDADFEQATGLWHVLGRDPGHQERYIENVSASVQKVASKHLRVKVYGMLFSRMHLRLMASD
jgi:catalase